MLSEALIAAGDASDTFTEKMKKAVPSKHSNALIAKFSLKQGQLMGIVKGRLQPLVGQMLNTQLSISKLAKCGVSGRRAPLEWTLLLDVGRL